MPKKKVLITGIKGQDGVFLTNHLIKDGVKVYGISRNSNSDSFFNKLSYINKNIDSKKIKLIKADLNDKNIAYKPTNI